MTMSVDYYYYQNYCNKVAWWCIFFHSQNYCNRFAKWRQFTANTKIIAIKLYDDASFFTTTRIIAIDLHDNVSLIQLPNLFEQFEWWCQLSTITRIIAVGFCNDVNLLPLPELLQWICMTTSVYYYHQNYCNKIVWWCKFFHHYQNYCNRFAWRQFTTKTIAIDLHDDVSLQQLPKLFKQLDWLRHLSTTTIIIPIDLHDDFDLIPLPELSIITLEGLQDGVNLLPLPKLLQ